MIETKTIGVLLVLLLVGSIVSAGVLINYPMNTENDIEQGNQAIIEISQIRARANNTTISANIDIDPNTLNLKSNGKWISCYIELPAGYNVSDINASTVLLNSNLTPELNQKYGFVKDEQGYIMDHDGDNISERMLKFDRSGVQALLSPGMNVTVNITGKLYDNTSFEGNDTIRVKSPPTYKIKKNKPDKDIDNNNNKNKDKDKKAKNKTKPDDNNNNTSGQQTNNNTNQQNNTNISANIKIVPVTINLKSESNWVTCFIELPSGYNISDINANSVLMNGNLSPVLDPKYGFVSNASEYTTDDDGDGNPERMFKFDREEVQELLSDAENKEIVELTITGEVNGATFEGSDTVKVINKEK